MSKNLVIVESPAKAKTIEGFLGKDYTVKSSFGHVRDLSKKQLGVDISKGFLPDYEVAPEKKKIVSELKKSAQEAEMVWLASDEDREGEAISWHLMETLGLDEKKTKRIVFHEITKTAILEAIEHPRSLDYNLVNAQQARRVLDRLVGFELSPLLWKKVKPALSAGRVQSVAVRLIVEREDEIKNFESTSAYRITGSFFTEVKAKLEAELNRRFDNKEEALSLLTKCVNAQFIISAIETKPAKKSPAPPFTTSTLQQEASRKLGFSVSKTMLVAQQLYESGKITYMRTDSVNLSKMALAMAKDEVEKEFGPEYVKTRNFTTKTKGAQEAHEAIRPTYMNKHSIGGDNSQQRLYELIWKRTIASQMGDAILEKTNVTIDISKAQEKFIARGEVIKFDGFLKVYMESTDDEESENGKDILPPVKTGQELGLDEINAAQRFTVPPPRYAEASLVKKLEELGIGRPSTYAPTISTIQKREYVIKEDREGFTRDFITFNLKDNKIKEVIKTEKAGNEKAKLFPTDIGSLVNKFLMQHFENIMDYNFTASVEKEFDEIAAGQKVWNEMIGEFYGSFHNQVLDISQNSSKFSGARLLGIDPVSSKNVFAKIGKYGPMVQIGDTESEEKPRFARLKKEQSMDTLTLPEALDLFKLPRSLGEYEEAEVTVGLGRFGPYVRHKNAFYSLKKTDDPETIGIDRAIEIMIEKIEKAGQKIIREYAEEPDLKVLNGRWGPYIAEGKTNYKIPRGTDPASLSLADCHKIMKESGPARQRDKKVSTKKTK